MKSYIERKDESMANEKLKFTSLEEAKEFLLKSKEENADVSQKQFLDAVSALNLDDDTNGEDREINEYTIKKGFGNIINIYNIENFKDKIWF